MKISGLEVNGDIVRQRIYGSLAGATNLNPEDAPTFLEAGVKLGIFSEARLAEGIHSVLKRGAVDPDEIKAIKTGLAKLVQQSGVKNIEPGLRNVDAIVSGINLLPKHFK